MELKLRKIVHGRDVILNEENSKEINCKIEFESEENLLERQESEESVEREEKDKKLERNDETKVTRRSIRNKKIPKRLTDYELDYDTSDEEGNLNMTLNAIEELTDKHLTDKQRLTVRQ